MKKIILISYVLFAGISCFGQSNGFATFKPIEEEAPIRNYSDCNQIPTSFSSYNQALSIISNHKFNISDEFNAEDNSFISGGAYRSCDGKSGFLIVYIKGYSPYIYQNVPLSIYRDFRYSLPTGKYYNEHIKGRYKVYLKFQY